MLVHLNPTSYAELLHLIDLSPLHRELRLWPCFTSLLLRPETKSSSAWVASVRDAQLTPPAPPPLPSSFSSCPIVNQGKRPSGRCSRCIGHQLMGPPLSGSATSEGGLTMA